MKTLSLIPILFLACAVSSSAGAELTSSKPRAEVEAALRQYFTDKYPAYADFRNEASRKDGDFLQRARKVEELRRRSPVAEIIHSFPHGPYLTIAERTELPDGKVSIVTLNLHAEDDGTCRVVLKNKSQKQKGNLAAAKAKPVTVEEIRKILE